MPGSCASEYLDTTKYLQYRHSVKSEVSMRSNTEKLMPDTHLQFKIVNLILDSKTEDALELLSSFYNISPPGIKVGTIKGRRKTVYAVYVHKERRIYALNSDVFYNPFIILHEFYHHLRSRGTGHRGSEKHANNYAKEFLHSYGIYRHLNPEANIESIANDITFSSRPTSGKTIHQLHKLNKERQD